MRVAYVLRYYPTLSETFVTREIHGLLARGVEVVVVSMGTRADAVLATDLPDVPVLACPRRFRLARLLRRLPRVDRFHAHFDGEASALAMELAAAREVPFSVTVHAVDLFVPRPGIARRLRAARPVVTVCAHHRDWIAREYGVVAEVVRSTVDLPERTADPSRQPPHVVAVARDVPKKDLARLRRAAVGVRLTEASDLPHPDVLDLLRSAQLFALPCRVAPSGDRDGVPVAMLEAMAMGLPVVTRPVAGIPELVDSGVGWIAHDFERALREALEDPVERARRGSRARERIATSWSGPSPTGSLLEVWGRVRL
ncbi:MAG: glycosyltransferase family 4 protein [Alphaproteobacteria bacterium]|nr:glycosyltransferase family 4 protein [Alphaproteobacteria bacterium]MCB9690993.1 glycosyltransferase family 4 protein [Alphaproteobacteria bacterium]